MLPEQQIDRRTPMASKRSRIASLGEIPPVECPCGQPRRAFAEPGGPASIHLVDIRKDARTHYHKNLREIYPILEAHDELELDGERIAGGPLSAVMIHPGCRHRAIARCGSSTFRSPPSIPRTSGSTDDVGHQPAAAARPMIAQTDS